MKSYKQLWDTFISKDNFELAYQNAAKGKSKQRQVKQFKENEKENLEKIRQMVINGEFTTSPYKQTMIYEPKQRIIYKLPFAPDRIVQHAIMNILKPIFSNLFIENSYACIEGRGQHKASIKCSEYVRKYEYCLKCDIKKFYPSISHDILSSKIHKIIKDEKFMAIIDDVIYSIEGDYNCPIGNYMSQWLGNFYLTSLDNYVLHILKCGAYERYCDDFLLFSNDKKYLHDCRKQIELFLKTSLELEFSKSNVFNTKQGVDFVGYRHFGKYVLVRKSTAKRIKRRFLHSRLSEDKDVLRSQIASTNGWLKHACSYHLKQKLKLDEILKQMEEDTK